MENEDTQSTETTGTALTLFEQRLAKDAADAAAKEKGGFPKLALGKDKKFSIDGVEVGPTLAAIILHAAFENAYYEGRYDPTDPEPPTCFALGYDEETLAPPADLKTKISDKCGIAGEPGCCPKNEWDSSNTGSGKACKNQRRIAFIAPDEAGAEKPTIVMGHTPPTTNRNLSKFIKQNTKLIKPVKPLYAFVTEMAFDPNKPHQVVTFKRIADLGMDVLPNVANAVDGIRAELVKPFKRIDDDDDAKPAAPTGEKKKAKF